MSDHDTDLQTACLDLVKRQVEAGIAQADAGRALAVELGALRAQLAVIPEARTALAESRALLDDVRPLLAELADRRAAERAAAEKAAYDRGKRDAEAAYAASIGGATRASAVAWIGSDRGRMALGLLLGLVVLALATMILPWVDLDALRALGSVP